MSGFWPFGARPERAEAEALLRAAVEASRTPSLYGEGRVPDDLDGRFEAATLFAALALIRLRREPDTQRLAQAFTDQLFRWLDSGLHEAGVGYQKVPKEMRGLASRYYGRLGVYDAAIAAADQIALAQALARNIVRAKPEDWPFAQNLAGHVFLVAETQARMERSALAAPTAWPMPSL